MNKIKLNNKYSNYLYPTKPFNFEATVFKPSHFLDKLDLYNKNKFWQTIRLDKKIFGLKLENKGKLYQPKIKLAIYYKNKLNEQDKEKIIKEINWRHDLQCNLKEFINKFKNDRILSTYLKKWKGMRNGSAHSLYELLIIGVVLQNATIRRTMQMLDALLYKFGTKVLFDKKELDCIWLPERLKNVSEIYLRKLKIGYRAKTIKRVSDYFANGKIDERKLRKMDLESVRKELIKIYGVGPETARILLFDLFHGYDVFDHVAPWQQKIYSRLLYYKKLVSAKRIIKDMKKRYSSWSALASHYIWEDIFWQREKNRIDWLEKEIRR